MEKQIKAHTTHDENGIPIYPVGELADYSHDFVLSKETARKPNLKCYIDSIRAIINGSDDLCPGNIIRHESGRIARNESRCSIKNWIEAHKQFKRYYVSINKLTEHLKSLGLIPNDKTFVHCPSFKKEKSSLHGQILGPNKKSKFEPLGTFTFPLTTATTAEFQFIDYEKTDKIRVLCNQVIKVIAHGKSDSEPDAQLANKCFQELTLGIGLIGGVK